MIHKRRPFIFLLVGVAMSVLVLMHISWSPTTTHSSQDTKTRIAANGLDQRSDMEARHGDSDRVGSPLQGELSDSVVSGSTSDGADSRNVRQPASFSEFMAVPGATAESYVVVDDALDVTRLDDFVTQADYENFISQLQRNPDPVAQQKIEDYSQAFYSSAAVSNGSIIVDSIACGTKICAATFRSYDSATLKNYVKMIQMSDSTPMYASVVIPTEENTAFTLIRLVFTTDPAVSALTM